MKKALIVTALAQALICSGALAQGINLSWNDCGLNGVPVAGSSCASNTGAQVMIGSFVAPAGLTNLNGMEAVLDLQSASPVLPDWWAFGPAGCPARATALSADFNFTAGPFNCLDYWAGQAIGGMDYTIGFGGPDRARIRLIAAIDNTVAGPVPPGAEVYAYKLIITNAGTTSCAGCQIPVCCVFNSLKLTQPVELKADKYITNPAYSNFVGWQGITGNCPGSVPTKSNSWGSIKSMYR